MIERNELLAFNFYKKEKFTGSYNGMRYIIRKATLDEANIFMVSVWPGPYNYESTEDSLKTDKSFDFTEDALLEITDYLNEIYNEKREYWQSHSNYV